VRCERKASAQPKETHPTEKAEAFLNIPEIQHLFRVRHDTTTSKLVLVDGCT